MKLRICGYIPKRTKKTKLERRLGEYAREQAKILLKDFPRITTVQVTFAKGNFDYGDGMKWLVKGNRVEIVIGRRHKQSAHWLVRHELRHARQILEGRINKSLLRVVFTNRRGLTRTFLEVEHPTNGWAAYRCAKSGRLYFNNEPWEDEVRADDRRARRAAYIKQFGR